MKELKLQSKLFASLPTTPVELANVLQLFPTSHLNWKPKNWDGIPGEQFSAIEQICHLRDIEVDGYHNRIDRMLKEHEPTLKSIDGHALVTQRNYAAANLKVVILKFNYARQKTIKMIEGIKNEQWKRIGHFDGYGTISMTSLIHFLCSHDFEHLASLRWLLGKMDGEVQNEKHHMV